jgi:2-octaprenylphenol hydroxylase
LPYRRERAWQGAELSGAAARLVKPGAVPDNGRMEFDVLIIGGGLAGLALAAALRDSRLSVALIEGHMPARSQGWDVRTYAVSPGNAQFLDALGIWQCMDHSRIGPVRAMEIYGDTGGRLDFSAYDSGLSELAWIIESASMQHALWEAVGHQENVTLFSPAQPKLLTLGHEIATVELVDGRVLEARLVVAADGADSWTRRAAGIEVKFSPYEEMGVVANFSCERPARETAFQWFRRDGVLAWLPFPDKLISMVWSTGLNHARELLALPPAELCRSVAEAGKWRLGELELATSPASFPLRLMRAPRTVGHRLALIGDAAHTIHPLSGHGINLGFQDAQVLADVLMARPAFIDCGDERWLRRYERARVEQVVALQSVTHGLRRLFRPPGATVTAVRNVGLNLTNSVPLLRDALVRYAVG